jgi:hypothetical protein
MSTKDIAAITRKVAQAAGLAIVSAGLMLGLATGTADASPTPDVHSHTPGMYGDPDAAAPYWRRQHFDDCALMSVADVIGQLTGHEPSEQEIIAAAHQLPSRSHSGPIYTLPADPKDPNKTGQGVDPHDVPVLLAHYGISGVLTNDDLAGESGVATGLTALEHYLGSGHKVIASVNAELIWGEPVETKDSNDKPKSDHALIVIGVDTNNGEVHLNDSGISTGRDETVPISVFLKSWATSQHRMTVTEETS